MDIYDANDMDEAVSTSRDIAGKGDIVLLSPASAGPTFGCGRSGVHGNILKPST